MFKRHIPPQPVIPEKTYADGILEGRELGIQEAERQLEILRAELQRISQQAENQAARADAATDLLLQHLGLRAISLAGQKMENEKREQQMTAVERLAALPDPTEDLPFGDPRGTFKSKNDASILGLGTDFDDPEAVSH